nr:MAG TPA: hypothetical protein [Caudoviricetes sp.]
MPPVWIRAQCGRISCATVSILETVRPVTLWAQYERSKNI